MRNRNVLIRVPESTIVDFLSGSNKLYIFTSIITKLKDKNLLIRIIEASLDTLANVYKKDANNYHALALQHTFSSTEPSVCIGMSTRANNSKQRYDLVIQAKALIKRLLV